MIEWFVSYINRLFIGGMFCMLISFAASKGSFAEPIRICLACFMLILVLTPLKEDVNILEELNEYAVGVKNEMHRTVSESLADQKSEIAEQSGHKLEDLLARNGYDCSIKAETDDYGRIINIELSAPEEKSEEIVNMISVLTGLQAEYIVLKEVKQADG